MAELQYDTISHYLFKDCERFLINYLKNSNGVNLPFLFREFVKFLGYDFGVVSKDKRLKSRLYMRLRRKLDSFSKRGYIELQKVDGFVWVKPVKGFIDLIINGEKLPQTLIRIHEDRAAARMILLKRKRLSLDDWRELSLCLRDYIHDVSQRCLVFYCPEEFVNDRWLFLPYQHRFMKRNLRKKLEEYDSIWSNASKYNKGIFITLTLNPKSYRNLLEASKLVSKLLNKFLWLLSRILGFRPCYICSFEPQKSGNPHIHLVIFGINEIPIIRKSKSDVVKFIVRYGNSEEFLSYMRKSLKRLSLGFEDINGLLSLVDSHFEEIYDKVNHFALTLRLERWGFGKIHYEYRIRKSKDGWVWANRRVKPRRCKTLNVQHYLRKYLRKTFSFSFNFDGDKLKVDNLRVSFYFASNKRFFTCSRVLLVKRDKRKVLVRWVFIGSFHFLEIPDWILLASGMEVFYDWFHDVFKFHKNASIITTTAIC